MNMDFVNLTPENLANEHLCCIIRSKKPHQGVEAKRQWLSDRLAEGHVFRKLNEKATVFIEYAPLETAWVPIIGDNYYYLYCLWVSGSCKGKGYGKALMEYCIADAREKGKSGICMLGAKKQKGWLSDQAFAKKYGFKVADTTENGYELLAPVSYTHLDVYKRQVHLLSCPCKGLFLLQSAHIPCLQPSYKKDSIIRLTMQLLFYILRNIFLIMRRIFKEYIAKTAIIITVKGARIKTERKEKNV